MYAKLLREAEQLGIDIYEKEMPPRLKGLYGDSVIWINKNIPTEAEKACILAEEMGHYHTSAGNILDQTKIENRRQEIRARRWAYEKIVPLRSLVQAWQAGVSGRYELAEYLGVTEEFLEEAIKYYKQRYGLSASIDGYIIYFDPLAISEY